MNKVQTTTKQREEKELEEEEEEITSKTKTEIVELTEQNNNKLNEDIRNNRDYFQHHIYLSSHVPSLSKYDFFFHRVFIFFFRHLLRLLSHLFIEI